ncbi:class I SAM-dependent methyltransferase [Micromonospora radicis]|uniref:Methyltransferase domain-containing protein n=1 Tax=Micromonospora radicis TaxID=1894971 RepID=A0A418MX31_9ACTN|nr:methyltransferase domain-containing protein [Micromonospora radicis]RIV39108.1 methyltransferase domain-containing protein [Micromonospora radicis]
MARIGYDDTDATAFEATRHLTDEGLAEWRAAVTRHLTARPGRRLLDLGAGTGSWARAFTAWFPGTEVVAVEPSAAMRARCGHTPVVGGLTLTAVEPVPQVTAGSLREAAGTLRREAHTLLQLITDAEYAAGVERLRRAARADTGPVVDTLDLLVLR